MVPVYDLVALLYCLARIDVVFDHHSDTVGHFVTALSLDPDTPTS